MNRYTHLHADKWLDTNPVMLHTSYYKGELLPGKKETDDNAFVDDVCDPIEAFDIVFCNGDANERNANIDRRTYPSEVCDWV